MLLAGNGRSRYIASCFQVLGGKFRDLPTSPWPHFIISQEQHIHDRSRTAKVIFSSYPAAVPVISYLGSLNHGRDDKENPSPGSDRYISPDLYINPTTLADGEFQMCLPACPPARAYICGFLGSKIAINVKRSREARVSRGEDKQSSGRTAIPVLARGYSPKTDICEAKMAYPNKLSHYPFPLVWAGQTSDLPTSFPFIVPRPRNHGCPTICIPPKVVLSSSITRSRCISSLKVGVSK